MIQRRRVGAWFIVAVAAIAAALADLLVECLSDRGVFGPAVFTDGSLAINAPVATLGGILLVRFLYVRLRRALRARTDLVTSTRRLRRDLTARAVVRNLPLIFMVQIAALWAMETFEQFEFVGHGFGGTVWLGGPPLTSLAVHAVLCVLTAFGARFILRAIEPRALQLIRAFLSVLGTVGPARRAQLTRRAEPLPVRSCLVPCRIGVRAPPAAVS